MMLLNDPVYDIKELIQTDYHIHTVLSRCGKQEMTLKNIIKTAEAAGLKEIAVTDHIHPGESWKLQRNIPMLQKQLAETETDVKVYLGAELSAYGEQKYTLNNSDAVLDYRLYAHNHYHMFGWEQPEDPTPGGYKEHCKRVMTGVITGGKADCMAHPFNDYYIVREFGEANGFVAGDITSLWTDNELGDLMQLGKENNVAWEINAKTCLQQPDFITRYWNIGKEIGVRFLFGTDAHVLADISAIGTYDLLKKLLH